MARGERNARHDDRQPPIDAYFGMAPEATRAGYSQPDALDNTGYSLSDPRLDVRIGDGYIADEVLAPLGGARHGRLSVASYGGAAEPTTGGYLGEAGAVWDRADYGGMPVGEFVGPQHAIRPPPLELGRERGVTGEHAFHGTPTGLATGPGEGGNPSAGPAPGGDGDDWGAVDSSSGASARQGKDLDRLPLSDREVYGDLYGEGRSYADPRGREDDGISTNDPVDGGGDEQAYRQLRGRRLRSDDPGDA